MHIFIKQKWTQRCQEFMNEKIYVGYRQKKEKRGKK